MRQTLKVVVQNDWNSVDGILLYVCFNKMRHMIEKLKSGDAKAQKTHRLQNSISFIFM
jgi:hypothetical protein